MHRRDRKPRITQHRPQGRVHAQRIEGEWRLRIALHLVPLSPTHKTYICSPIGAWSRHFVHCSPCHGRRDVRIASLRNVRQRARSPTAFRVSLVAAHTRHKRRPADRPKFALDPPALGEAGTARLGPMPIVSVTTASISNDTTPLGNNLIVASTMSSVVKRR